MGTVQNRVLQDRRRLSRISVQMECRFISNDKEYGALILDLSQGGALISSALLSPNEDIPNDENPTVQEIISVSDGNIPATESKIYITLEASGLKAPLTLKGKIRRSSIGMSEYGKVAQFGIEFENTPLELLRLISLLSSRRKASRISTQIECRFKFDDTDHVARILDLSKDGALLSSTFIPAQSGKVSITLQAEGLEKPLMFEGMVKRNAEVEQGEEGQFGVEFETAIPELSQLIRALSADRHNT